MSIRKVVLERVGYGQRSLRWYGSRLIFQSFVGLIGLYPRGSLLHDALVTSGLIGLARLCKMCLLATSCMFHGWESTCLAVCLAVLPRWSCRYSYTPSQILPVVLPATLVGFGALPFGFSTWWRYCALRVRMVPCSFRVLAPGAVAFLDAVLGKNFACLLGPLTSAIPTIP